MSDGKCCEKKGIVKTGMRKTILMCQMGYLLLGGNAFEVGNFLQTGTEHNRNIMRGGGNINKDMNPV